MKHATYVGPIAHLVGKTALIRGENPILAQFDDMTATRSGRPIPKQAVLGFEPHARFPTVQLEDYPEPPHDALGFGWHEFSATDFKEEVK